MLNETLEIIRKPSALVEWGAAFFLPKFPPMLRYPPGFQGLWGCFFPRLILMAKMPFMKFYPQDYLYDTRILTLEERAVLMDLLCFMWNAPERGKVTGTAQDLAQLVGIEWLKFRAIIDGMKRKNVVDLTESNQNLTIISRRMVREEKYWESNRIKQRTYYEKHRPNQNLTDKKSDTKKSEVIKDNTLSTDVDQKSNVASPKEIGPTPENLIGLWNSKAHPNLPRVNLLTPKRKIHVGARLKEHPGREFWEDLIERVNRSPLLRGENDRSWKCTFDWILNVNNLAKILEGNYEPTRHHN